MSAHREDEFDGWLQEALGEYREAEPLAGIEQRILQRLELRPVERRHGWWMWGAVATCAALLLVGVWLGVKSPTPPKEGRMGHPASTQVATSESKELAGVSKSPTRPKEGGVGHPEGRMGHPTESASPAKPGVFPVPVSLTPEERAFMATLQKTPDAMSANSASDAAITIAEIEIKPLAIGGLQTSEPSGEKQ